MKLNKEILRLAGPSILANITVPLVGMVDMAVVGHLGGVEGYAGAALIGGISVGTMLFDLLYWNFAFLRAGTGGLTAQAYGRHLAAVASASAPGAITASGAPGIVTILGRALRIALLSGVALIALQWVVVQLAFLVVDCTPEVRALATRYFYIRIWAAPATLSLFALKGWFIGLQDTLRPMLVDLWVNLVNILLSLGLGFGLHLGSSVGTAGLGIAVGAGVTLLPTLGFAGVAWGTVIAQWTGLFLAILLACKYLSLSHFLKILGSFCAEDFQQSTDNQCVSGQPNSAQATSNQPQATTQRPQSAPSTEATSFFTLNRDLFLRSVGMIAVYIGFTVIGAGLGDRMLAVSSILMKLLMLFSYFTDGFAYAGEALTGRFVGEHNEDGVRSTVRGTFAWGFGLAGAFMLLYGVGGTPLLQLMTSDTTVVEAGRAFLPWLLLMPLIGCPAFTWDGIYIGATASKDLRNSVLLCAVGFFIVWFVGRWLLAALGIGTLTPGSLSPEASLHLLMAAYFVHLAIRSLYQTVRYRPAVLLPHFQAGS
ncbi:MAG: MATE family efflux transporter [Candidatus Cryptobacteroides sp.]|nr:MATE family efflux transporter [Candidatus Cryptobacteroides sp.]